MSNLRCKVGDLAIWTGRFNTRLVRIDTAAREPGFDWDVEILGSPVPLINSETNEIEEIAKGYVRDRDCSPIRGDLSEIGTSLAEVRA
jgi:hypothetical protein